MVKSFSVALRLAVLAFMSVGSIEARADVNDVQIDWMISKEDWAKATASGDGRRVEYKLRLLPSELFVADSDIVAADGAKLLPAGSQLYALTGPAKAACSQKAASVGYLGAANRICLRDDNGDGRFDSYWTRRPLKQIFGKDDWFILNDDVPAVRMGIAPFTFSSASPDSAEVSTDLRVAFSLRGKGLVEGGIGVQNGGFFSGYCLPVSRDGSASLTSRCLVPDLLARASNFEAPDKQDRRLEVIVPQRSTPVRFQIRKAKIMGFTVETIRLL